jgi:hypothetical protein
MVAMFRNAFNKAVDVQVDSIGGLVERRVDEGVVAYRSSANHYAMTQELNPRLWVRPDCGGLLDVLRDLSPVFGGQSARLCLALVKLDADIG